VQQELDSVQKQISAKGENATEKLYAQQKEILARARQHQEAFAAAVTHLTDIQKKESLLAVEVVRLWLWISRTCCAVRMLSLRKLPPSGWLMFVKVMIAFVLMYLGNTQSTGD
jgi:hypothetical protein